MTSVRQKANFKPQTELIPLCTVCAAHSPRLSLLLCIFCCNAKKRSTSKTHSHLSYCIPGGGIGLGGKLDSASRFHRAVSEVNFILNSFMLLNTDM